MSGPSKFLPDLPIYDVKAHLAQVQRLHASYPYRDGHACLDKLKHVIRATPPSIQPEVKEFLADVLDENDIYIPREPTYEDRDYLTRIQKRFTMDFEPAFRALDEFIAPLAHFVPSAGAFHIPLSETIGVDDLIEHCFKLATAEFAGEMLFPDLYRQLSYNAVKASGLNQYDGKKRITPPKANKLPPYEKLHAYLAKTPFLKLATTTVPFGIPLGSWQEHGFIFAKSGHGKTQTMRAIIASLLKKDCALFLIDGLGALIENVDRIESIQDRLVVFDCAAEEPPNLNLFRLASDDLYFYLFKAIDQSFTPRQATMISYIMELMGSLTNPTLATLVQICKAPNATAYANTISTLSPFAQMFFNEEFFAKRIDPLVQQTKNQISQRILTLGRLPKFDTMLSAPSNDFDAFRFMQEKKIVVINTNAKPSSHGGLGEASSVIGRFMLAQILDAARTRPKDQRHLALIVLDEAKHYLDEHTSLILSDARQYGLGLLLATQFPDQLSEGVRKEVINNTSVKMCGPAAYSVVAQVHRDMRCDTEFILGMKKKDYEHAEWACYVDNLTPHAVKLTVPFGAIEKLPLIDVPPRSKPATTERTVKQAEQPATTRKPAEKGDTPPSTFELDTDH